MGVLRAGFNGTVGQPSAQVIDGSLKFQRANGNYLTRAITSEGNRRTWTYSCWIKRDGFPAAARQLWGQVSTSDNTATGKWQLYYDSNENLNIHTHSLSHLVTSAKFRDTGWYHVVQTLDTTNGTADNRVRLYINGVEQTSFGTRNNPSPNAELGVNTVGNMVIGTADNAKSSYYIDAKMSQCYFIDGQALGPENFGFTDGLTGIWRPKKYTGTFGTNGFWLPMDGNSPIGQDKSGKGNDFTPVNFGNSAGVDQATGALPIFEGAGGAVANAGVRTDANAANLVLALPLVGNKEDVVASINSAQTNVTVTNNGSVPFQTTQSNFYGGSAFFEDSSSDNLTFTNFGSRFEFTGDYTIEAWIYPTDSGAADGSIFVENSGSNYFAFNFDPGTQFNIYNNSSTPSWSPSTNLPPANKWSHIALVRSGSTQTIYVNGNSIATNTASGTHGYASPTFARIGGGASSGLDSYIQDLRVYKGVAKYTSNFIPASTNPDILPDTPSGVSGGSKLTKITEGAVAFDGSGDYLSVTGPGTLAASSNWCMECFFYCTGNNSSTYRIMSANESAQSSEYLVMRIRNGQYQWYTDNANSGTINTATFNKWTHMALTKEGTTVRGFIDGVKIWETTDNNADSFTTLITGWGYGGEYFPGFISNARFVNGSSVYTANFTPPAAPLTNITNTYLLCCQSSTSATEGAVKPGNITANGDAAATTFSPFNTINTVRGQETGYPTLNPLQQSLNSTPTISNGGLTLTKSATGAEWTNTGCTMTIPKSGKWFWEITWTAVGGSSVARCGVADSNDYEFNRNTAGTGLPWLGSGTGTSWSCDVRGYKYHNGTETTGYLPAFAAGDVMGILLDRDENTITYTRNGISGGVAHSNVSPDFVTPGFGLHAATANSLDVNFGQKPFKFPPPDGFQPLNGTTILPETVIVRPDQYFGATTYSGSTGTGTIKDENIEFTPDFVWVKDRTGTEPHALYDTVRGSAGNGNFYRLSTTSQNGNNSPTNELTSMIRGGFTANNNGHIFYNSKNYVSWMWKAGGSSNTFNIDDVGYANASDVNMSVGALNNIAFNKSQAWSSNASGGGNAANAFNGVGPKKDNYSHSGSALTLTFSPALTGKIVVYGGTGAGSHNSVTTDTFTLSDGSVLSSQEKYDVFPYFTKLDFGEKSGITSLVCSAGYTLYGITLDGKLLVDSGVSINAPTIANSKCSVGTKQGFSIINFTNTNSDSTHAHGLTQKPDFIVMKKTNGTSHWPVYHSSMGPEYGYLNLANAFGVGSGEMWNYTEPNDYYVTLKGEPNTFGSAGDVIMYCWHNVPGLQKFGFYAGNGDTNGPFIETGFRPALVWVKSDSTAGQEWVAYDNKTAPTNEMSTFRYIETTANDQSGRQVDFLSNGFKFRNGSSGATNNGSRTYIYCAWAEAPAFNLYGGQSNAR